MQMAFYLDQTRCTGCFTCVVACKDWNDVPPGLAAWRKVKTLEKGRYPELFVAHLPTSCYHCAKPACVKACPVGAITKRAADGVVLVDREACLGHDNCDMCLQVCPYESPQFGDEPNAKMQMCNFCVDRLEESKQPICVAACPLRALEAGPLDELRLKYPAIDAEGFAYEAKVAPSVAFKPKKDAKDLALAYVSVAPAGARVGYGR